MHTLYNKSNNFFFLKNIGSGGTGREETGGAASKTQMDPNPANPNSTSIFKTHLGFVWFGKKIGRIEDVEKKYCK